MTKQFMGELTESPYFERILQGHNVIMVLMTGSRILDIVDERSDFDLMVITDEVQREINPFEYFMYKSKKVHWSYCPIKKLISNEDGSLLTCVGEIQFAGLREQVVLYKNPNYASVISYLFESKDTVALIGTYGFAHFQNNLISKIINGNEIRPEDYCKHIYHLCCASYFLLGDTPDKAFLLEIKRIRWKPVAEEYKKLAVERLRLLKDYILKHPIEIKRIINEFNEQIDRLL